jgi:hypothetical protein
MSTIDEPITEEQVVEETWVVAYIRGRTWENAIIEEED